MLHRENVGQDGKYTDLNFATYIAFSMPIAVINLFLTWIILSLIFLGRPKFHSISTQTSSRENTPSEDSSQQVARVLQRKLNELGKISFHEWTVIVLITVAVILWLFRDPQVFPGWFFLFKESHPRIGDSTVAVAILVILFIVPKDISYFRGGTKCTFVIVV